MQRNLQALSASQAARLEQSFRLLKDGATSEALALARGVAREAPGAPDGHHALALGLLASNDFQAAAEAFTRALQLAPEHPLVLGNYAQLLQKQGRPEEALRMLQRAASAAPGSAPAATELGIAAFRQGHTTEAIAALERAVTLAPGSARAWHGLGNARRRRGDLEGAEEAFHRAVELAPGNARAWVNLGVVRRLLGRPAEALPCLAQARKAGYAGPELGDAEAGALADVGHFGQALGTARSLARQFPDYVAGQVMLVHLLWEHGAELAPGEDPFETLRTAVNAHPEHRPLQLACVGLLLETAQPEQALAQLQSLRAEADQPLLVALEAQAHELLGETGQAGILYELACRDLGESDPSFLNTYARHLLKAGKWDAAAMRAQDATRIDPQNQEAWAYLGTAWRLMDDPREFWLCDYERLVALLEVEPPRGFPDTAAFLDTLEATLDPLHRARREPIHQSLRGGSQTPGKLFGRCDPVIEATAAALLRTIERHIADLPEGTDHPFLHRKARSVRFSGSWSVKLWSAGKHVNHIHPEGWMSSAFYVSLPPSVRDQPGDDNPAGYIQFGQPPVELGLDLPARRVIRPRLGHLALFPSYMWHGTVPFEDEAPRITVAFDMTPTD
jgi:Flp pilus assembly protein TadD